ncbi:uncharacterized protein YqgC (DUF456 family) [Lewinella marina]|uniref:DUF4239 domain-containing protein n=1 Tax=Neolewinella marina TaxID=438751 RepID=A0A2G0CIU7_9BACT|nr:DUF4239 domain-containing protein [Neolewinella marina]NJB84971.1 uncharacterized protein YqgC (DUF456 family) [Neolewinella marina]PHK99878.1 hypothetical protein CGL56_02200 [Neolewinella marina]
MYHLNSLIIVAILFVLIVAADVVGLYLGQRARDKSDNDVKSQTSAIQGGIIGMLALILGFTFNMSIQRYDTRAGAEVEEANAIGTAELRAALLPEPYHGQAAAAIDEYIELRLESSHMDLTRVEERKALNDRTSQLQQRIWDIGVAAADASPSPVRSGYFLTSVNDMIDAQGRRLDVLNRHVPPAIFYLLFVFFIATGGLIGYSTGLGQRRSRVPALVLNLLICLLVFIIIDLDRPRRGIIEVKQDSMEALR